MVVLSKEIEEPSGSFSSFSYDKRSVVVNDSREILPHMDLYMVSLNWFENYVVQRIKKMNKNSRFPSLLLRHQSGHLVVVNGAIALEETNQILSSSSVFLPKEEDVLVTDARSIKDSTTKAKKVPTTNKKMPRISDIKSFIEDSERHDSKETQDDNKGPEIEVYVDRWTGKALKNFVKNPSFILLDDFTAAYLSRPRASSVREWLKTLMEYNNFLCLHLDDGGKPFRELTSRIELLAAFIISNHLGYVRTADSSKPRKEQRAFFLEHWEKLYYDASDEYLKGKKRITDQELGVLNPDDDDQTSPPGDADPTRGAYRNVTQSQERQEDQINLFQNLQDGFLTSPEDRSNTNKDHSVYFDIQPNQKRRVHEIPPQENVSRKP